MSAVEKVLAEERWNPDVQGASEYRAIHEVLTDALANAEPGTEDELAFSVLSEVIGWATELRNAITDARKPIIYQNEAFIVGDLIELIEWAPSAVVDDNETVPPGTRGKVVGGCPGTYGHPQLWVEWENGSRLAPSSPGDRVRKVRT